MKDVEEYIDIVGRLEDATLQDGLTRSTKELMLEAKKEIESLRTALMMFSEEFEKIQRQDAEMMMGIAEGPLQ
jgi:hypothetical protein